MSRITYFKSPFSNIRPRRGLWPNPGLCHSPKNPFIAFGPNMFSTSCGKRALRPVRQLAPVPLPERIPQPSLARPYFNVTAVGKIGEHPVRLGNRWRSLQRRQRRRELPMPRERLQKLPLLALLRRRPTLPRTGLRKLLKPLPRPRTPAPPRRAAQISRRRSGMKWKAGPATKSRNNPPITKPIISLPGKGLQ